jgi:hypothetical protein
MKNQKEIIFTNIHGYDYFPPKPAQNDIPDWYKDSELYLNNDKVVNVNLDVSGTIKKCLPIFDAITAGYILYTQVDVQVTKNELGNSHYLWPSQDAIHFHPVSQAELHPANNNMPYPKWNNPYSIITPPGYSSLFLPPLHRPNKIFTILQGLVDTDSYNFPVALPFVLNDKNWTGVIPAGTPMAQVIPFKRESWEHKIGSDKERQEQEKISRKLKTLFFNSYKRQFWSRKEYR